MPTIPYAKILVSLNGGALNSGGLTAPSAATVQLSGENTSGWNSALWEMADVPAGFTAPAGWSTSASGTIFYVGTTPPIFSLPAIATRWGKWLFRLTVNNGVDELTVFNPAKMIDITTGVQTLSTKGQIDIAAGEGSQFSGVAKGWAGEYEKELRVLEPQLGAGGGVTWGADLLGSSGVSQTVVALSSASAIPLTTRLSSVTNPATIGMIGAANNITIIGARNSANSGNIPLLGSDASNNLILGDASAVSSAIILAAAAVVQKIGAVTVASLGIAAGDFIRLGSANFPTTGGIRLGNNVTIQTANTVGTQCNLIGLDASNFITVGDASVSAQTNVYSNGIVALNSQASLIAFQTGGISRVFVEGGGMVIGGAGGSYGGGVGMLCLGAAPTNPTSSPTSATVLYGINGSGLPAFYGPAALLVTTVGAAGGASAPPATPLKWMLLTVNGTAMKVPLYNP